LTDLGFRESESERVNIGPQSSKKVAGKKTVSISGNEVSAEALKWMLVLNYLTVSIGN
jgi:hypothetical protein|tara:strand:- start:111 stop:284 length:174 start_codon:yes stop_codon:yes gene_type:complete